MFFFFFFFFCNQFSVSTLSQKYSQSQIEHFLAPKQRSNSRNDVIHVMLVQAILLMLEKTTITQTIPLLAGSQWNKSGKPWNFAC